MERAQELKKKLYKACQQNLEDRIQAIQRAMGEAQEAANHETKSSAGDKHETGRAMMQLETEKLNARLSEVLSEQDRLRQIRPEKLSRSVEPGALVITDTKKFYFSMGAGQLSVEGEEYFALSMQTPLGQVAKGRKKDDTFELRGQKYRIKKIC